MILSEIRMNLDDKLAMARAKYLRLISDKEQEIKELRNKILVIDEIENEAHPTPTLANNNPKGFGLLDHSKYAKMGLSEAAIDAAQELIRNHVKDITKTKISNYMQENGFKPKGKNFGISVDVALRRAVETGKFSSQLNKEGRRIYTSLNPV